MWFIGRNAKMTGRPSGVGGVGGYPSWNSVRKLQKGDPSTVHAPSQQSAFLVGGQLLASKRREGCHVLSSPLRRTKMSC